MLIQEGTPTRDRTIQGEAYEEAGQPNHTFSIPRPFKSEMFSQLAEDLKVSAEGIANTLNQTLAENAGNNMATRIKAILKRNEKKEDGDLEPLPDQMALDGMIAAYDFSGVRASTGETASLSPVDREALRLSKTFIRNVLQREGYDDMAAPVTVAKKNAEAEDGQISFDEFTGLAMSIVEGEGFWGEPEFETEDGDVIDSPYYARREAIMTQAQSIVDSQSVTAEDVGTRLVRTKKD